MVDVFVSYCREDKPLVLPIVSSLKEIGLEVWYDQNLGAGMPFRREIKEKLSAAQVVVVCWSATSVQSDWVYAEAEQGRTEEKLVPLRLGECELPLPFGALHCLELREPVEIAAEVKRRVLDRKQSDPVGAATRAYLGVGHPVFPEVVCELLERATHTSDWDLIVKMVTKIAALADELKVELSALEYFAANRNSDMPEQIDDLINEEELGMSQAAALDCSFWSIEGASLQLLGELEPIVEQLQEIAACASAGRHRL